VTFDHAPLIGDDHKGFVPHPDNDKDPYVFRIARSQVGWEAADHQAFAAQ